MSKSVFGDLDALLEHADSKFSLVNIVTKRARQLNNWIRVQQLPPTDRREYFASEPLVDQRDDQPEQAGLDRARRDRRGQDRVPPHKGGN